MVHLFNWHGGEWRYLGPVRRDEFERHKDYLNRLFPNLEWMGW